MINEIEQALERHELIKIKLRMGEREERDEGIEEICEKTQAENIQRVGNILTIYKKTFYIFYSVLEFLLHHLTRISKKEVYHAVINCFMPVYFHFTF